jgi:hypothetical protein
LHYSAAEVRRSIQHEWEDIGMSKKAAADALEEEAVALVNARAHPDDIIGFMKARGLSQGMTSIMLMKVGFGDPLTCKALVLNSVHWRHAKASTEQLHEAIDEYVTQGGSLEASS